MSLPTKDITDDQMSLPNKDSAGNQVSLPYKDITGDQVSLPNKHKSGDQVSLPNTYSGYQVSLPNKDFSGGHLSLPIKDSAGDQVSLPNKDSSGGQVSLPNKECTGDKASLPNLEDIGVHLTSDLRSDTLLRQVEMVKQCDLKIGHFYTLFEHFHTTNIPREKLLQSLSKVFAEDWSLMKPAANTYSTLYSFWSSWYFYLFNRYSISSCKMQCHHRILIL